MRIKTSELTGAALDWAVEWSQSLKDLLASKGAKSTYNPSTDWAQGGPIIERERINLEPFSNINGEQWSADGEWDSPTPLIAAMRCYVASQLGDEVEIPEELK
jgi:hypothetical protein